MKQKDSQTQRTDLGLLRGRGRRGGLAGEFRISGCKLAYTEGINNKVSELHTISRINHNRKEYKKEFLHPCSVMSNSLRPHGL